MKVKYYEDADLLSIRISKKLYHDASQSGDIIVHYAEDKEPVLIEILNAAQFLKETDKSFPKKIQKEIWANQQLTTVSHRIKK